jgi:hypothetical protein
MLPASVRQLAANAAKSRSAGVIIHPDGPSVKAPVKVWQSSIEMSPVYGVQRTALESTVCDVRDRRSTLGGAPCRARQDLLAVLARPLASHGHLPGTHGLSQARAPGRDSARRVWLNHGLPRREVLPRREDRGDLRGHEQHAVQNHPKSDAAAATAWGAWS